jgi:5-methylcytosine-specific restriction endonuclease McrA
MRSGSREQRINAFVMERDEGRCHRCGEYGADEVDHVIPLEPAARLPEHQQLPHAEVESVDNRAPIHAVPCHRTKTAEEAARARNR